MITKTIATIKSRSKKCYSLKYYILRTRGGQRGLGDEENCLQAGIPVMNT